MKPHLCRDFSLRPSSHPSWVCGLKPLRTSSLNNETNVTPFVGVWIETSVIKPRAFKKSSHPSWVCGLKHNFRCLKLNRKESHPSWVCGLKLDNLRLAEETAYVTPFVGVWIETLFRARRRQQRQVTPFVGVWIETNATLRPFLIIFVTPFVGVWIETFASATSWKTNRSHPSWVCGLKLHALRPVAQGLGVTPFVGVWIETWTISSSCMKIRVTPFVCVWIETPLPYHLFLRLPNHTLRGCMD